MYIKRAIEKAEIYVRIFKGPMPEPCADPNVDWETCGRSHVNACLQRDIRSLES